MEIAETCIHSEEKTRPEKAHMGKTEKLNYEIKKINWF